MTIFNALKETSGYKFENESLSKHPYEIFGPFEKSSKYFPQILENSAYCWSLHTCEMESASISWIASNNVAYKRNISGAWKQTINIFLIIIEYIA